MSVPPPTHAASPPTPPLPPPSSSPLDQLQASFAAFTPRYRAAIHDPTSIRPLLIPADTYFSPRCPVCAASFPTVELLHAHFTSAQHASQLASVVAPTSAAAAAAAAAAAQHPPFPPPWLRQLDPLVDASPAAATAAAAPTAPPPPPAHLDAPAASHAAAALAAPDALQYRCELCNIVCDTMAQLTSHSAGQKHRKKADLHSAFRHAEARFASECIRFQPPSTWHCLLCAAVMHAHNEVLQHMQCVKHTRLLAASAARRAALAVRATPMQPPPASAAMAPLHSPVSESPSAALSPPRQQPPRPAALLAAPACAAPVRGAIVKPLRFAKVGVFACSVCNVACTSNDNLNVHLASARHRKKVEGAAANHLIVCPVCCISVSGAANYEAHLRGKAHAKREQQRDAAGGSPSAAPPPAAAAAAAFRRRAAGAARSASRRRRPRDGRRRRAWRGCASAALRAAPRVCAAQPVLTRCAALREWRSRVCNF